MQKKHVTLLRWIFVVCGVGSAITGLFVPAHSNEANFVCWFFIFLLCIPIEGQ